MRIVAGRLLPYRLPFKRPWRTHQGVLESRSGWLLELTGDTGLLGYGDCAPLPMAGTEQSSAAKAWLDERLSLLSHRMPGELLEQLPEQTHCPAARHALETALLDLLSQAEGQSLRHWLSPTAVDRFEVNAAAGALDHSCLERIPQLHVQGYRVIKLKVGLSRVENELALLQQLARHLPQKVILRLDANCAWTQADAARFVQGMENLPIESLEEPLREPRLESLRELQQMTTAALALDESLSLFAWDELFAAPPVKRLILKPCVLGGLLPARRLAQRAAQADMETLVTSTLESAVGIQAACQLAASLISPKCPLAQGLATSDWFGQDTAEPPAIEAGYIHLTNAKGLGTRPNRDLPL